MGDKGLLDALPAVRRARGFRLYDGSGRRWLDMYQDGGGAILGHRAAGAVRDMKDALSRGLAGSLPTVYTARLEKAAGRVVPGCSAVRVYPCAHSALAAVGSLLGRPVEEGSLADPGLRGLPPDADAALWRPFLPEAGPGLPAVRVLVLPGAGPAGPAVVCARGARREDLAPARPCPAVVLAAMLRGTAALASAPRDPAVAAAVDRAISGGKAWARRGPYLAALFDPALYPAVFHRFLAGGVLLCPEYPGPSILPAEASAGELAALTRLLCAAPGG
jgi:hypothetical protein